MWRAAIGMFLLASAWGGAVRADQTPAAPLPGGGRTLLTTADDYRRVAGNPGQAPLGVTRFDAPAPVGAAVRVEHPGGPHQLEFVSTGPVALGDTLLLRFYLRGVKSMTGSNTVHAVVEDTDNKRQFNVWFVCNAGPDRFQRIDVPFPAKDHYAAGKLKVDFRFGETYQTAEIGGLELLDFGKSVRVGDLPVTRVTYAGREADAPWRAEAAARIERIRKAELAVEVVDPAGRPVPNAQVAVRMNKHAFPFGSCVNAGLLEAGDDKFTDADRDAYRRTFLGLFNTAVDEGFMKWPQWEMPALKQQMLRTADWLAANGVALRGHCLVWPSFRMTPRDLPKIKNDKAALQRRVLEHITEIVGAFRGRVTDWDVTNELSTNHDMADLLTRDDVAAWYKAARAADPDAKLVLNEFHTLTDGGHDKARQDFVFDLVKDLKSRGAPIDMVAEQGHFGWQLTPPVKVLSILDRFQMLGVPTQITELDIEVSDEQLQADYLRDFLTVCFSHPNVAGVTQWGFWEGRHWKPAAALFRRDWSAKPAAEAYKALVFRQWWTSAEAKTDAAGKAATRGFLGEYRVTATAGGSTATVTASLSAGGRAVRVVLK